MKDVIIIGTGGHAKVIADIVLCSGDNLAGFLTRESNINTFVGRSVLGSDTDYQKYADAYFVIAIGNADVRERIAAQMNGVKWYTAVHPSTVISKLDTALGEGSVIMANAVINPCTCIGRHCIINTSAVVEHDNVIDDFAHISVGAKLAGTVHIGKKTWVGVGATVSNNLSICDSCTVGAGAVVIKDITEAGTYVGVPAVKVK